MSNYELVLGKDLKVGDIIIHNHAKSVIVAYSFGHGAGSIEFGEYICVIVNTVDSYNWPKDGVEFWTYQNCPMIKYVGEN